MRTLGYVAATVLAASIVASPATARAQQGATSAAAAEKLFHEGRALMADGKHEGACPKLAESLRLDPAVGTALNLAECYEHVERFASAWVTYRKAETMARRAGQLERQTAAAKRAEALEKGLSQLTISIAAPAKGLVITLDGEPVGEGAWGSAVPIDGGKHVVEASAPGRRAWRKELTLAARGERSTVEIPELSRLPATAAPASSTAPEADEAFPVQRTIGWITLGAGVVALGTGFVFGAIAKSNQDDANTHCSAIDCDADGIRLRTDARSSALLSTVLVTAGAVATVGGVVLVLTAPKRRSAPRVGVSLSPAAYGVWATF